jgi:hypothetical protein
MAVLTDHRSPITDQRAAVLAETPPYGCALVRFGDLQTVAPREEAS